MKALSWINPELSHLPGLRGGGSSARLPNFPIAGHPTGAAKNLQRDAMSALGWNAPLSLGPFV
jgi:hypothetical protein